MIHDTSALVLEICPPDLIRRWHAKLQCNNHPFVTHLKTRTSVSLYLTQFHAQQGFWHWNIHWHDCPQPLFKAACSQNESWDELLPYRSIEEITACVWVELDCLLHITTNQRFPEIFLWIAGRCAFTAAVNGAESSLKPQCVTILCKLKGNEKIAAVKANEAEICWHELNVGLSGWTWPSMFYGGNHFLLYITAGVKGRTGVMIVRALSKCQPTVLHINNL